MTAFRNFQRVHNQKIEVILPQEFEDQEVEIIILPKNNIADDLSHLENEIQKGIDSGTSSRTHNEIMESLRQRYV